MGEVKTEGRTYQELLSQFLENKDENALEKAKEICYSFVRGNIYPEDIVQIHMDRMDQYYDLHEADFKRALIFLRESLIAYRKAHQEYENLILEQIELKSEIQVAANMQKTLLRTEIPQIEGIDIGAISVPNHQMNGDYFHFVTGEDGSMGVAIADVIGKGVPAALSMSMIKYAMDSFHDEIMNPSAILRNLNMVVERNVAPNMFITMFYGQFFPKTGLLKYASAGHEHGFIYHAKTKEFTEIDAKGLVLGVLKNTKYQQYELQMEKDDVIVLLTDGVTECRFNDRILKREEVAKVIQLYDDLPAQEQVESVYNHFKQSESFNLRDDFTLIIIKKMV